MRSERGFLLVDYAPVPGAFGTVRRLISGGAGEQEMEFFTMKKVLEEKKPAEKSPQSPITRILIPEGLRKAMVRVHQEADVEGAAR